MRLIATLTFYLLSLGAFAQFFAMFPNEVTVVQINAKWNDSNTREDLEELRLCDYRFGWLEEQPLKLQETIKAVPVVVIYVDGKPAWQYMSDLSFRLDTPFEEIQTKVYDLQR